jgi:hypothetical protein
LLLPRGAYCLNATPRTDGDRPTGNTVRRTDGDISHAREHSNELFSIRPIVPSLLYSVRDSPRPLSVPQRFVSTTFPARASGRRTRTRPVVVMRVFIFYPYTCTRDVHFRFHRFSAGSTAGFFFFFFIVVIIYLFISLFFPVVMDRRRALKCIPPPSYITFLLDRRRLSSLTL